MTTRKIRLTITAATMAVAVAALTAPLTADAGTLTATATVAATTTVNSTTNAATTTYTGAATQSVPFTFNISSTDTNGFTFAFTGANSTTVFDLKGPGAGTVLIPYTIFNTATTPVQYTYNVAGAAVIPANTSAATYTFNADLPVQAGLLSGAYTDTITYTITSL